MKKKVCWSAIRSDSQKLVDTQKLVAHLKKVLFSSFLNVFYHFRPCQRMGKHVFPGWNTQQIIFFFFWINNLYLNQTWVNQALLNPLIFGMAVLPFLCRGVWFLPKAKQKKIFFANSSRMADAKKNDECSFRHPKICNKFKQFGDTKNNEKGCDEICDFFHPNACRNSLKNKTCSS